MSYKRLCLEEKIIMYTTYLKVSFKKDNDNDNG